MMEDYAVINKEFPDEYEVLFGRVSRLLGTSVFVKLEGYDKEGVMSFSEVAPGRIRNIRDYVNADQRIVCKVIRVNGEKGHIDLSLRRVSQKEKKDLFELEKHKKEAMIIIELVLKDKSKIQQMENNISQSIQISELPHKIMSDSKEGFKILKKAGFSDEEANKFVEIILEKEKDKKVVVKNMISLASEAPDGIEKIKKILDGFDAKVKINYISAPIYSISVESNNYKDANKRIKEVLDNILARAKKSECKFEILEK